MVAQPPKGAQSNQRISLGVGFSYSVSVSAKQNIDM